MADEDPFGHIPEGPTEDDPFAGIPEEIGATTALGAAGRSFGTSVLPAAGAAAGAALLAAPFTGGSSLLTIPAMFVGGAAGAIATDAAQRMALEALAPETAKRLEALQQADIAQHPLAAMGGRLAGSAPTFAFAPGQTLRGVAALPSIARGTAGPAEQLAAATAATQIGLGAASGVAIPLVQGQPVTPAGVAEAAIGATLFGQPRARILIPRSIRALEDTPGELRELPAFPEETGPLPEEQKRPTRAEPVLVGPQPERVAPEIVVPGQAAPAAEPVTPVTAGPRVPIAEAGPSAAEQFPMAPRSVTGRPLRTAADVALDRLDRLERIGAGEEPMAVPARTLEEATPPPAPPTQEGGPSAIQEQQATKVLRDVPQQPRPVEQGVPAEEGAGGVPPGDLQQAAGRPSAEGPSGDVPLVAQPGQALGIQPQPPAAARRLAQLPVSFARWFSEWMPDRVRRLSLTGGKAKEFADQANTVISESAGHYGKLSPVLDEARREAGKLNVATRWMQEVTPVTPSAGTANGVDAVEGTIPTPIFAQKLVDLVKKANLEIGRLLEPVIEGFKATGKWQRNLTGFGYDVIKRGAGKAWDAWTEGVAKANNLDIAKVQAFFRNWKAALDETGSADVARIEKINQDFSREMPRAITHVRVEGPLGGGHWEAVIHAKPFNYLEATARRAASVRAFREQFPKGTFGKTFKDVMADLPGSHKSDLEGLVRSLQGHPTDSYAWAAELGLAPDQPVGSMFRTLNQTVGDFMARLVLTGQLITQTPETIVGSTPIFLGYKNYIEGLIRLRELYPQLEINGQVSRMLYDNSFDPSSPIRSRWRIAGNLVTRGFAENVLNEFQEGLAGATARVIADKIRNGALSDWERSMLPQTFRAMGFNREQAAQMVAGRAPELLTQFERNAAAWLTSGNKALAQGSRAGANRLFNSVFRFQSYPMMKLNQMGRVWSGVGEAFQNGTTTEKKAAVRLLLRFMFGTTAQGALYTGLTALFFDQLFGAKIKAHEAKDEKLNFAVESFLSAMGGPMYLVYRGARAHGALGVGEQMARTFFPYQVIGSLWDATHGDGAYRDLDAGDRFGKFVQQRMPGARALDTGLSLFGLSQENKKLQTAIRAFYRWRIDEMGFKRDESWLKRQTGKEFKTAMKQATIALQNGDTEGYMEALMRAAEAPDTKAGSIAKSLRGKKLLEDIDGRKLKPEDMEKLIKRIGPEAVDRLQYYDAMLEAAAQGIILEPQK